MAEKGSKIGKLGGPILGGISGALGKAAEKPTEAGGNAARDLGERIQGKAAYEAGRSRGIGRRVLLSLFGGQTLPTRRATAERDQRGIQWNSREDELSAGVIRGRFESASRERGVAAGKAAIVEVVGRGGRDARQGIIFLIGTESWVEFQGARIQRGRHQGKRATEVQAWQDVISQDTTGELWGKVTRMRPDRTPDVIQAAEADIGVRYEQLTGGDPRLEGLSRRCLEIAIGRFGPSGLPGMHEGIFQEVARLNDPALSQQLFDTLRNIKNAPGDVGRNALGSLLGPREVAINAALAPIHETYTGI